MTTGFAQRRRGGAAVELAVVLPLLIVFLLGSWEVGRLLLVMQVLSNATREGGRQASTGDKTTAQVQAVVAEYCTQNGLAAVTPSQVTVTNLTSSLRPDPSAANQMDQFQVTVTIPFDSVRWIVLSQVTGVRTLSASTNWYSMADIPITVNSTIPLN